MGKESASYQLISVHMSGLTNSDGEYQEIIRTSDEHSVRREKLDLQKETRLLIDRYASKNYDYPIIIPYRRS